MTKEGGRDLVFSDVEVRGEQKKKVNEKFMHYKALFNLNKSLLRE